MIIKLNYKLVQYRIVIWCPDTVTALMGAILDLYLSLNFNILVKILLSSHLCSISELPSPPPPPQKKKKKKQKKKNKPKKKKQNHTPKNKKTQLQNIQCLNKQPTPV